MVAPKKNIIKEKSFNFAFRIFNLQRELIEKKEFEASKQLFRCGTSIGANVAEAVQAQSKRDFLHKMSLALKEASETEYWLRLLHKAQFISNAQYDSFLKEIESILKILVAIIKTTKKRMGKS